MTSWCKRFFQVHLFPKDTSEPPCMCRGLSESSVMPSPPIQLSSRVPLGSRVISACVCVPLGLLATQEEMIANRSIKDSWKKKEEEMEKPAFKF